MRVRPLRFICLWSVISLLCGGVSEAVAQRTITFVDEDANPLIGVYLINADTSTVAISDANGSVLLDKAMLPDTFTMMYFGEQQIYVAANMTDTIITYDNSVLLSHVEIVGRTQENSNRFAQRIHTIDRKSITALHSQNTANLLQKDGNVYVQKSQMGGGSPVIRGFEANRVLMVVDGVRLNNAIYRGGHLHNVISINDASLDKVDVIFGAGALTYGSDALGGVLAFKTLPVRLHQSLKGGVDYKFASANAGQKLNAHIQFGNARIGMTAAVGVGSYGNLRVGSRRNDDYSQYPNYGLQMAYDSLRDQMVVASDSLLLRPTGYDQIDILHKTGIKVGKTWLETNLQYSKSTDIPRYDALTQIIDNRPKYADWYYGPQKRLLASAKVVAPATRLYDKLIGIASYQAIEESRHTRLFTSSNLLSQHEVLDICGLTLDASKWLNKWDLHYGVDAHYNILNSDANDIAGATILTRYPDGKNNQMLRLGSYAKASYTRNDWTYMAGSRIAYQRINLYYHNRSVFDWPEYVYDGITSETSAWVSSLHFKYEKKRWQLSGGINQGYRSPNIDDLAKIRVKSTEISIPNTELKPEKSLSTEIVCQYTQPSLQWQVVLHHTWLSDAIVRQAALLPNGDHTYVDNAGQSYVVTANANTDKARVYGVETKLDWQISSTFRLTNTATWTRGTTIHEGVTSLLGHIPPLYGLAKLAYANGGLSIAAEYQWNAAKPISQYGGTVDNPELALPTGTPYWSVINVNARYDAAFGSIGIGIDNIADTFYRPFASGISGAGRSVVVNLSYRLESKPKREL